MVIRRAVFNFTISTRRGCPGGPRKLTRSYKSPANIFCNVSYRGHHQNSLDSLVYSPSPCTGTDLHNAIDDTSNIQSNTFTDNQATTRDSLASSNDHISNQIKYNFVPQIMLINAMSLAPKIDEVAEFVLRNDIDLAFVTETWLKDRVDDIVVGISVYSILRRDRHVIEHGGVCLYIKDGYRDFKSLNALNCCEEHELFRVYLRPKRLPRGFSCIVAAVVYHPTPSPANDNCILEHLLSSLTLAESMYPNCALVVCGDFNRLDTKLFQYHYGLDLILTNLHNHFQDPITFPLFGLSDHNTVLVCSKIREEKSKTSTIVFKRDLRNSRKAELGRFLKSIDWNVILSGLHSCEELFSAVQDVITTGLDILMPLKRVRVYKSDAPWMTNQLKSLILRRQHAFHDHGPDSRQFKFYRNLVNRKRRSNFYNSKIE